MRSAAPGPERRAGLTAYVVLPATVRTVTRSPVTRVSVRAGAGRDRAVTTAPAVAPGAGTAVGAEAVVAAG